MTTDISSRFTADGLPVLIGSVPLSSHKQALEWILSATPEIPLWPQLPSNPFERMLPQFVEGIPCIVEENPEIANGTIRFDISRAEFEAEMLSFYEDFLAVSDNPDSLFDSRFSVSKQRAAGLYEFVDRLEQMEFAAVKGQITGPFTMLTGIKDENGKAGYFDDTVRDMVIKGIGMKAAWQVKLLSRQNDKPVMLFIDEPALAGLGSSAFIGVTGDEIRDVMNEVAAAIHLVGGLVGIHVCANTDWSTLLSSDIDVLSFDAYGFFDRIAPLKEEVYGYLDRGGIIAWGGVPTSKAEDIEKESTESLVALWEQQMDLFVSQERSKSDLLRQTFITPSCGTGSLTKELAQKVLALTSSVARELRKNYGQA